MASKSDSAWTLGRIASVAQATSGIAFSVFALGHLAGHTLAHFGTQTANAYLHDFRRYYQISEKYLVLAPMAVHMVASIVRFFQRPATPKSDSPLVKERNLHRNLGWAMMLLIPMHAWGARFENLWKYGKEIADKMDFNQLSVMAGSLPLFVIPYIVILGTVGLIHSVYGVGYALQQLGISAPTFSAGVKRAFFWGAPMAMISTGLAMAGVYFPQTFTKAELDLVRMAKKDVAPLINAINLKFGN